MTASIRAPRTGRRRALVLGLLASVVMLPLAASAIPAAAAAAPLHATIERTEYGIPHIVASDFTSLGYGFGYAFTQDNVCVMADDYVTVDAQRSRWFGPTGTYAQHGNGITSSNEDSDLFWQQVIDTKSVEALLALRPPVGLRQEVRDLTTGYVAGWNRRLADIGGAAGITDPACRGAAWVHPITEIEAYRRFYQLILLASSGVFVDGIATAQPPALGVASPAAAGVDATAVTRALADALKLGAGSNAVAIGSDGTRDHTHGILLGNPHFPWVGTERFYEAQLTIPGVMNVSGAMLFGVPLVLIGRTATMAWSHTVSTARRFTLYQLTLVPGTPTSYLVDGVPTPMTSTTVTIQEKGAGGALTPLTRTLYSTRYGPVVAGVEGVPLPWTGATAFTERDANADDARLFNHFLETDMASTVQEEYNILLRYQGIPWVNTVVADSTGHALYADIGSMPNVPDSLANQCDTALGVVTFNALRIPTMDGSMTSCDWLNDPDAIVPGHFGPSHMPHLFRSDYVTNSNDSYWLSNPKAPLEGFAKVIGDERAERSLRTRVGLLEVQARIDGTDSLGAAGFTRQDLQDLDLRDSVLSAELTRDAVVTLCRQPGGAVTTSGPVDVGTACDALAAWDLRDDLTSRGALLWMRFWDRAVAMTSQSSALPVPDLALVFTTPFSASDPVNTPNTLNPASPIVRQALGDAITDLRTAGIAFDAPLGTRQGVVRDGAFIPIPGGPGDPDGVYNAIYAPFAGGTTGFAQVDDGSSFIQVVTWDGSGCPDARTILTYSLSTDPTSPWHSDQTRLFSGKRWVTDRFCTASILASPSLSVVTLGQPAVSTATLPDTAGSGGAAAAALICGAGLGMVATPGVRRRRRSLGANRAGA